ncbi:secretion protein EspH, partial [Escherichia coli]|nr:secretion protein EspH [Escherichia coli]
MSSSLSGIILNTSLTSHHMSWASLAEHLHVLNEDIVDEIQLKARTQQRHHRVYSEMADYSVVS